MAGRPDKEINWEKLDLYLMSGASQKRIADSLCLHPDTLRDRVKEKYGMEYSIYSAAKSQEGRLLLEAAMLQKALKSSSPGNTQMLIWLGKVKLGQRELPAINPMPNFSDLAKNNVNPEDIPEPEVDE